MMIYSLSYYFYLLLWKFEKGVVFSVPWIDLLRTILQNPIETVVVKINSLYIMSMTTIRQSIKL